jgi:diaminopropionate ammonia-lyase
MSVFVNPAADRKRVTRSSRAALAFHRGLPGYAPTPLHDVGGVRVKDESHRLGLPAFKVLGVSWAVERALRERPDVHTLIAASAGNHGRAVAHVARQRGLRARIILPERASPGRRAAIASEGAEVIVVAGTYEQAVIAAASEGAQPGCMELADVGVSGPAHWVIDGYATLFAELPAAIDTILVPAGVGSLAAAAARHGAATGARVIVVEPVTAACVTASLRAGEPVSVPTPGTSMAGMDCAEVSLAAWPDLLHGIHATVTVCDAEAHEAMRELAARGHAIGDCGAAPLAAMRRLGHDLLGDNVVLIATEGVTDPESYARVIGRHLAP